MTVVIQYITDKTRTKQTYLKTVKITRKFFIEKENNEKK